MKLLNLNCLIYRKYPFSLNSNSDQIRLKDSLSSTFNSLEFVACFSLKISLSFYSFFLIFNFNNKICFPILCHVEQQAQQPSSVQLLHLFAIFICQRMRRRCERETECKRERDVIARLECILQAYFIFKDSGLSNATHICILWTLPLSLSFSHSLSLSLSPANLLSKFPFCITENFKLHLRFASPGAQAMLDFVYF